MPLTRRIEQDQAGDVSGVRRCVGAYQQRAKGVADQYRRSIARRIGENSTQLGHHPGDGARSASWIAPAQASAIVGARRREGRNGRVHARPAQGRGRDTGLEENGRPAIAGTDQMQLLSADADHRPGRGVQPCAASSTNELVQDACSDADNDQASDRDGDHRHLELTRLAPGRRGFSISWIIVRLPRCRVLARSSFQLPSRTSSVTSSDSMDEVVPLAHTQTSRQHPWRTIWPSSPEMS